MGTSKAQVANKVATLAGGSRNQDRYIIGDTYAAVLDGASSFARQQPHHDGAWYAEHLAQALDYHLSTKQDADTAAVVSRAIADVAQLHNDDDTTTCPTSTIALTRWDKETVEVYVLGDSTISVITPKSEEAHTDARLGTVAQEIRNEYRSRLIAGHGFDEAHRAILTKLQRRQVSVRNTHNGYWIAGDKPEAAKYAYRLSYHRSQVETIVMATDGAASLVEKYGTHPSWRALASAPPEVSLQLATDLEDKDPQAQRWPRSKIHDDKTLVILNLR